MSVSDRDELNKGEQREGSDNFVCYKNWQWFPRARNKQAICMTKHICRKVKSEEVLRDVAYFNRNNVVGSVNV